MTLQKALESITDKGGARASVIKHLDAVGIRRWSDINKQRLADFRTHLLENVSGATARTITARFRGVLERNSNDVRLPDNWREILSVRADGPTKTYLTPEELERFEKVDTRSELEETVKCECLLAAFTGATLADIEHLTVKNLKGGNLVYVSQRTGRQVNVPAGPRVRGWIAYTSSHRDISPKNRGTRGDVITRLCERACLFSPTVAGGQNGPKCLFVTPHSFLVSFCTNLVAAGVDLPSIMRLAGHTNIQMTMRYVAEVVPEVTDAAQKYLGVH